MIQAIYFAIVAMAFHCFAYILSLFAVPVQTQMFPRGGEEAVGDLPGVLSRSAKLTPQSLLHRVIDVHGTPSGWQNVLSGGMNLPQVSTSCGQ